MLIARHLSKPLHNVMTKLLDIANLVLYTSVKIDTFHFVVGMKRFVPISSIFAGCYPVRCVARIVEPYSRNNQKRAAVCRHICAGNYFLSVPPLKVLMALEIRGTT